MINIFAAILLNKQPTTITKLAFVLSAVSALSTVLSQQMHLVKEVGTQETAYYNETVSTLLLSRTWWLEDSGG